MVSIEKDIIYGQTHYMTYLVTIKTVMTKTDMIIKTLIEMEYIDIQEKNGIIVAMTKTENI